MLLIDGVKYKVWTPATEDEFERVVKEHAKDIFGENSIYLDKKQKLNSLAGVGSIPDGLVIVFGNVPEWHIVEVELSSHDPYGHIVPQVDRFLNGIDNRDTRNKIIEALYDAIYGDEFLKLKTRRAIGLYKDVHKFLSDLIARPPTITIVIEEYTSQLREALKKYTQKRVVEFQTFTREGVGLEVHAHLFEPLYKPSILARVEPQTSLAPTTETIEIKVWPAYMRYEYIGIRKKFRHLFPDFGATIELITDEGDSSYHFKAKVGTSSGSMELWGLGGWFGRNPHLKEGDIILITPVEPMKKYRLEIVK